jgi:methylthioribose-1-phosphate isomerase
MLLNGRPTRTIWPAPAADAAWVIDQRVLPHRIASVRLASAADAAQAISNMTVRGAPLIGVTAAYGLALQARVDASDAALDAAARMLIAARPTAVNLAWAVGRAHAHVRALPVAGRAPAAWAFAGRLADDDVATNEAIGRHGLALLRALAPRRGGTLNVLTHCNAGWLATVDRGTALAPIYLAHAQGMAVHVWVDETRPRNQGASLTAFELREQGVPHTVITDNAGGHLMQRGCADAVLVGCDRVSARGDVANKIGTYLKALAAHDCGVPFYVAMPLSTLDRSLDDGLRDIPIEQRDAREVTHLSGRAADGSTATVQLVPEGSAAANPAFDVTPARLVTALVTERGVVRATREAIASLVEDVAGGASPVAPA